MENTEAAFAGTERVCEMKPSDLVNRLPSPLFKNLMPKR